MWHPNSNFPMEHGKKHLKREMETRMPTQSSSVIILMLSQMRLGGWKRNIPLQLKKHI